jgi:hypothetical protein
MIKWIQTSRLSMKKSLSRAAAPVSSTHRSVERERERERVRERERDRQTEREGGRERETETEADRERQRERDRQRERTREREMGGGTSCVGERRGREPSSLPVQSTTTSKSACSV